MKNLFLCRKILSIVVFIISGYLISALAVDKEKTLNVSKGDKIEVSSTNGNIKISVWSKDQAYIKAKNIDDDELDDLMIEKTGGVVKAEFKGQDSDEFYFEISIPAYLDFDVSTGAGNVSIAGNISGKVEIATGGGNIDLNDIESKLSVSTGGGNVTIGNINGESKISSGGGNIKVGNIKSRSEINTAGGNIVVGNAGGNLECSTAGGNISVGKGSGRVELSTAGGNINLDGVAGGGEINTAGGNINLKDIGGSIEANTAGGNIYSEFSAPINGNCELNTASGDIDIKIPVDAKVSIVASVYAGKKMTDSESDKLIKSDFDAANIDFNKNNLIKKYLLNGGGSKIELNTASGKIKILKK